MRRIDLFCKLVGPLVIALVDGISTTVAIWVILATNASSIMVEYYAIAKVEAQHVSALVLAKSILSDLLDGTSPSIAFLWVR